MDKVAVAASSDSEIHPGPAAAAPAGPEPARRSDSDYLQLHHGKEEAGEKFCFSGPEVVGEEQEKMTAVEFCEQRKKRRRRQRKKWKPHNVLSWEEREKVEERNAERATRILAKRKAQGRPTAPFNTTQFLMNEHDSTEPDMDNIEKQVNHSHPKHRKMVDDEDFYSSPEDEGAFLRQEFEASYNNIHAERLQTMSRNELIEECLSLEKNASDMADEHAKVTSDLRANMDALARDKRQLQIRVDFCDSVRSLAVERVREMTDGEVCSYAADVSARLTERDARCEALAAQVATLRQLLKGATAATANTPSLPPGDDGGGADVT